MGYYCHRQCIYSVEDVIFRGMTPVNVVDAADDYGDGRILLQSYLESPC